MDFSEFVESLPAGERQAMTLQLLDERQRELVEANVRQELAARLAQEAGERPLVDGIGQCEMSVDPVAFHYWGQREGYDCWGDRQFRHEFKRDNPAVRVKSKPKNVTLLNQWGQPLNPKVA